jgi:hypothetical protein
LDAAVKEVDGAATRAGPRVRVAVVALLLVPALLLTRAVRAGDTGGPGQEREQRLNERRRESITRGCRWIASRQRDDGSFGDDKGLLAISALSTLALMSDGSAIGRGPYGDHVRKGVEYLVRLVESNRSNADHLPEGYFHAPNDNSSQMHGQGFATLTLASALASASTKDGLARRIREVVRLAVQCAQTSQTSTGGWGYKPTPTTEHEGSVTVTIAQGLRAARDAGIHVNDEVVRRGINYLVLSQKRLPGNPESGSFKYSVAQDRSTYALTAAAISSFYLLGVYGKTPDHPDMPDRILDAVAYMKRQLRVQMRSQEWFYYGHFYAAWAAWQMDGEKPLPDGGDAWTDGPTDPDIERTTQFWGPWHAKVYPVLIDSQLADGHWHDALDRFAFGDLLPTAFAVLTLAIPDEQLPIFQR